VESHQLCIRSTGPPRRPYKHKGRNLQILAQLVRPCCQILCPCWDHDMLLVDQYRQSCLIVPMISQLMVTGGDAIWIHGALGIWNHDLINVAGWVQVGLSVATVMRSGSKGGLVEAQVLVGGRVRLFQHAGVLASDQKDASLVHNAFCRFHGSSEGIASVQPKNVAIFVDRFIHGERFPRILLPHVHMLWKVLRKPLAPSDFLDIGPGPSLLEFVRLHS
jgi:hypothetical protein